MAHTQGQTIGMTDRHGNQYEVYTREMPWTPFAEDDVRPLGRHVLHDSRSLNYRHVASGRPLVTVVHERHIPILDQGEVGSCTGNAMTGALGTSPVEDALPATHPALNEHEALVLYSAAEIIDGGTGYLQGGEDEGSSGLSVCKGAKNAGLIGDYRHATTLADALDALQDGPVLWGTNWLAGMDAVDSDGFIHFTGSSRGGHELELRAYYAAGATLPNGKVATQAYVQPDNSWNATWGFKGSAFISVSDLGKSLADDGDITIPDPLAAPVPAPTPAPAPAPGAASFLDADPALAARVDRAAGLAHEDRVAWLLHHLREYFRMT